MTLAALAPVRAHLRFVLFASLATAACTAAEPAEPGRSHRDDTDPFGLYRDFLDGKYDALGHPLGAAVWEAESDCDPVTGEVEAEGWGARAGEDQPGLLCAGAATSIGRGRFTLNVRALVPEIHGDEAGDAPAAFTVRVVDGDGELLAEREVSHDLFRAPMTYQNVTLSFTHRELGPVFVDVDWPGDRDVRIDYLELFRATRSLVVTPRSGLLEPGAELQVEILDPPQGATVAVSCDGADRTDVLGALLESGEAVREESEFRAVVTAPADVLLQDCPLPARVRVDLVTGTWTRATSRVTYYSEAAPCSFEDGKRRVLLTGFEPFPADSSHDNSSERAVLGFDASARPGDTVMRLILPVEWQSAAAIVADAVDRCDPDVVIGFGQGRWAVDVETTAYNVMDSSAIAGGTPDNRGVVMGGDPIAADGPDTHTTGLAAAELLQALTAADIDARESDDPGRYICNNLFYSIMEAADAHAFVGGFIHLPYMTRVDDEASAMLQRVVDLALAHADAR